MKTKKLHLNKITVCNLNKEELLGIKGGNVTQFACNSHKNMCDIYDSQGHSCQGSCFSGLICK